MFLLTQASLLIWFSSDGDRTSGNHIQIHLVSFPSFFEINSYEGVDSPYFPISYTKKGGKKENEKFKLKKKKRIIIIIIN